MPKVLSMECEKWANRELKRLAQTTTARRVKIEPKPPAQFIGRIRIPLNDELVLPEPLWKEHWAVLADGLVRDEIHPNGLPMPVYRSKFQFEDALTFTVQNI